MIHVAPNKVKTGLWEMGWTMDSWYPYMKPK